MFSILQINVRTESVTEIIRYDRCMHVLCAMYTYREIYFAVKCRSEDVYEFFMTQDATD